MDAPICECGRPCRRRDRNGVVAYRKKCRYCSTPNRPNATGNHLKRMLWREKALNHLRGKDGQLRCSHPGCPFVAEDEVQMDVHHKDGNRENDDPSNWELLCVCCHRLVTKLEKHPSQSMPYETARKKSWRK